MAIGVRRLAGLSTALAGTSAALAIGARSTDLPCAMHEAGHAIFALHVAERGIPCREGRLVLHGTTPTLLKYVTITPRQTDKGVVYLGETKLTTRWRHMQGHAQWQPGCTALCSGEPKLQSDMLSDDLVRACTSTGPPRTLLTLLTVARIGYLMGGRVAEDTLRAGKQNELAATRIEALISTPGYARGDLRKSQQLANAEAALTDIQERAFLEASYHFCDAVLTARWSQVQALAGALLARGTMDGNRLEALLERLQRAQVCKDDWMHAVTHRPLLLGVIWAVVECPQLGPCAPGPATCASGSRYALE